MANEVKLKLAIEGGQIVSQTIDGVTKKLTDMGGASGIAKNMLSGMAASLTVGAFLAYTKATIDAADAVNDLSQRVGVSVRDLAKYELAATQSGTTMEALAKGIKGIAVNLQEHGDALRKAGITATTADGAMQQLADVFASMPDGMEKTTLATKLFGKAGMDLIPMLNLGSAGLQDAAAKSSAYADQMALLAPLSDAFNDNLATMSMASQTLGMTMVNAVLPSLVQISDALVTSDSSASGFAKTVGSAVNITLQTAALLASDVAFVFRGMGREIGGIIAQFNALGEGGGVFSAQGRAAWTAVGNAMREDADSARVELDRWQEMLVSGAKNVQDAYNKRQGTSDKVFVDSMAQYKAIIAALKEKNGVDAAGKKLAAEREAAEKKALAEITKSAQARADLRTKEYSDVAAYMREESNRLADTARASEDAVRAAQDEYDNHGKLQSEIAATTLVRLQDQLVTKTAGTEAYESLMRQIEAQKQLIGIMQKTEVRDAAETAAKDLADANRKAAEESSKYWEDALMRAFESGKGFFQSLWDTIKNTLKTQVLKVLVTGVIGGVTGTSALASAGSSMLGGAGSSFLGNAASSFMSGSLLASNAAYGAAIGTTSIGAGSQAAMLAAQTGEFGAAGLSATAQAAGGLSGTIASALPYVGAFVAAAAMINSLMNNDAIASQSTGDATISYDAAGNITKTEEHFLHVVGGGLNDTVQKSIDSLYGSYSAIAKSLGIGTVAAAFSVGGNTGKDNADPQFAIGSAAGGQSYSIGETKLTEEAFALAASRAVFTALQGSELPGYLSKVFDGITASTATQDQINQAIAYAGSLKTIRDAMLETREPLQIIKDNVAAATAALATSADTFKVDFVAAIDAGISPDKLASWQALGAGLDALKVAADETAKAAEAAAEALAETNQGWQDQLDVLTGATTEREIALRNTTEATTRSLMRQVYAQEDLKSATDSTVESYNNIMNAAADIRATVAGVGTSVSDSIFSMQYGLEDNAGKYSMLDVKGARLEDQMFASTDIYAIAKLAQDQISLINTAWSLLDPEQQKAQILPFEDKLNTISDFVMQKGADPVALARAQNEATAKAIAEAVKAAIAEAMADPTSALAQAAADVKAAASIPAQVTSNVNVTVTAPAGSEVSVA